MAGVVWMAVMKFRSYSIKRIKQIQIGSGIQVRNGQARSRMKKKQMAETVGGF